MDIPVPPWFRKLWDIRLLVLLSLSLQIILWLLGNRRRYTPSRWINLVVWSAYSLADVVPSVALAKLSQAQVNESICNATVTNPFWELWAPLLLLHLGGPDTIAAFSLEDHRFWNRRLFFLGAQASLAVHVIFGFQRNSKPSIVSIAAFVAGFIKSGTRLWVLKSVSSDKSGNVVPSFGMLSDFSKLQAYELFKRFKSYMEVYDPTTFYYPWKAWELNYWNPTEDLYHFLELLNIQMKLMYDLFYTSAAITYTKRGLLLHCIRCSCSVFMFVGFFFHSGEHKHWPRDSNSDISITVALLVVALASEIYGFIISFTSSEWIMLSAINRILCRLGMLLRGTLMRRLLMPKKKWWSNKVGQFNLHQFCGKSIESGWLNRILVSLRIRGKFDAFGTQKTVSSETGEMILTHIYHLSYPSLDTQISLLKQLNFYKLPFHEQILVAHIATERCYSKDHLDGEEYLNPESFRPNGIPYIMMTTSVLLSRYMMHLLLKCRSILPVNILDSELELIIYDLKRPYSDRDGRLIARVGGELVKLLREESNGDRWRMLNTMWMTMLYYAAMKGKKDEHIERLREGGELLTLIWMYLPESTILPGVDITRITAALNSQVTLTPSRPPLDPFLEIHSAERPHSRSRVHPVTASDQENEDNRSIVMEPPMRVVTIMFLFLFIAKLRRNISQARLSMILYSLFYCLSIFHYDD
ncbi:hypothetical protein NMG60_11000576 [Bertholletia excelsa]